MRGTVRSLHPPDAHLAQAGELLAGAVLLRMGRGLMKRARRSGCRAHTGCAEYRVPLFNPETTNEDALPAPSWGRPWTCVHGRRRRL